MSDFRAGVIGITAITVWAIGFIFAGGFAFSIGWHLGELVW